MVLYARDCSCMYNKRCSITYIHVLMRDDREKKEASKVKQTKKAKQHSTPKAFTTKSVPSLYSLQYCYVKGGSGVCVFETEFYLIWHLFVILVKVKEGASPLPPPLRENCVIYDL